jgi:DNA-binding CsgD family transcriptional regulator
VTRAEKAAEAARLRAQGLNGVEVAERMGISKSYAYGLLNDPDGSGDRERKSRYDLQCVECGGRVNGTTPGRMIGRDPVCLRCSPHHNAIWTREAIILAIQEWADEHGGIPPSANQCRAGHALDPSVLPNVNHVRFRFGTWNDAIRAAGFEPHLSGPVGGFTPLTPEQREECARRYAAGESTVLIAADLGCSPRVVAKWASRGGVPIRPAGFGRKAA